MKKIFLAVALFLASLSCSAQSAEVIRITKTITSLDGTTLRPGTYPVVFMDGEITIPIEQDWTTISTAQYRMFRKEYWSAAQGHGYVCQLYRTVVRSSPNDNAKVIGRISAYEDGYPDAYECLGVVGNWYKVRNYEHIGNWSVGYVRKNMVEWQLHDPAAGGYIR